MSTFAGIATLPGRPLERTLRSLRPQVDRLGVYLNGFDDVLDVVHELADEWVITSENRGSGKKLHWAVDWDGFYFACDDDLEYPSDYVARLLAEFEEWGLGIFVTACGRTLRPDARFWSDWTGSFRYIDSVPEPRWINYLGGCAMAFHAPTLRLPAIEPPNEEEAILSVWAQRERVPIRLVARAYDWPKRIPLADGAFTLYQAARREQFATRSGIIQQVAPWRVHQRNGLTV